VAVVEDHVRKWAVEAKGAQEKRGPVNAMELGDVFSYKMNEV